MVAPPPTRPAARPLWHPGNTVGASGGSQIAPPARAIHDFHERKAYSLRAGDESFWSAVYAEYFADLARIETVEYPDPRQFKGIDRVLHMTSGDSVTIDEKKRARDYPDILLEYLSNSRTRSLGWVEKPLYTDYIAYAFMPSQTVYLYPAYLLRRAWLQNKLTWLQKYPPKRADNHGYYSLSCAVPIDVLDRAISGAGRVCLRR